MDIESVTAEFEKVAPLKLAEPWDNVGLLVEPSSPKVISSILFTNDLTHRVLTEAISSKVDLIFSYHPPLFAAVKHLRRKEWKENIILNCIERNIAVYSPHTALDACQNGVNDWLISCFDLSSVRPVKESLDPDVKFSHQVECLIPTSVSLEHLSNISDTHLLSVSSLVTENCIKILVNDISFLRVLSWLSDQSGQLISVSKCEKVPLLHCGMGRIGTLENPVRIADAIALIKKHVGVNKLRISFGNEHQLESLVSSVAVCAGSGSSVLKGVNAELYVTGEMSHHDLLDIAHRGITVILCEHSNSERGFLVQFVKDMLHKLPGVKLVIAESDADPIVIL